MGVYWVVYTGVVGVLCVLHTLGILGVYLQCHSPTHNNKPKASKDNKTESTLRACLTRYRELVTQCKPSDVHTHDPLSASDARRVMAAWVYGGLLGHVRTRQLQLLVECCDPSKQAPTTRTRAMRALGMAVEADPRVLGQPDVQQGVSRALEVLLLGGMYCVFTAHTFCILRTHFAMKLHSNKDYAQLKYTTTTPLLNPPQ